MSATQGNNATPNRAIKRSRIRDTTKYIRDNQLNQLVLANIVTTQFSNLCYHE